MLFLQPEDCFSLEDFLEMKSATNTLTKHIIDLSCSRRTDDGNKTYSDVRRSIEDLIKEGVRYSTLFPDLDGFALEANCTMKGVLWE